MRLKKTSDKYECKKCESLFVFQGVAGSSAGTICFVQQGPNCLYSFPWKGNNLLHFLHLCLSDVFPVSWMKFFLSRFSFIAYPPPLPQGGSFGLFVNLLTGGPVPCICMHPALLPGLSASFSRVQPPGATPILVICRWPKYRAINKRLYSC